MLSAELNHNHAHLDVAICDRREFDRAALRALCSHGRDLSVVAEVEQPDQLTQALAACVQLVILIGRSMLRGGGDQLERIRHDLPQARIVVVGVGDERVATAVPTGAAVAAQRSQRRAVELASIADCDVEVCVIVVELGREHGALTVRGGRRCGVGDHTYPRCGEPASGGPEGRLMPSGR